MSGRVTLQQVADAAGVSRGTASVILNDRQSARFAADTASRVRQAADRLGYRPNRLATALLQGGTQTLALISADVSGDHFAADLIRGASQAAGTAGQLLFVAQSDGRPAVFERLVHRFIDQGVDGFVYATSSHRSLPIPQVLAGQRLVLLNAVPAGGGGPAGAPPPPAVVPDDEEAGRRAGGLLREAMAAGATRATRTTRAARPTRTTRGPVLLLGRVVHAPTADDPRPGLAGALRERGLRSDLGAHGVALTHLDCPWWPAEAREALDGYLRSNPAPAAICALNDRTAMGAYDALRRHGLRVGDDVPIVSFDGSDLADWLDPTLSSLRLPLLRMGARAVELLVQGAAGGDEAASGLVERVPLESPDPHSMFPGRGDPLGLTPTAWPAPSPR